MANIAGSNERGQLFLVGAFALALLLVVLALTLNSVVYTGTLATADGTADDGRDVVAYHHNTVTEVRDIVEYRNRENNTSHGTLYANVSADIEESNALRDRQYATDGAAVNTTLVDVTNETRIEQERTSRTVTNRGGAVNWTVADSVSAVRFFRLNVSRDSLYAVDNESCLSIDECFTVVVDDGSDQWELFVNTSDGGDEITVTAVDPDGTTAACSVTAESAWLNLTEETLGGTACAPLNVTADADPPYNVAYRRGDRAEGNYDLLVEGAVPDDPNFDDDGDPSAEPLVYDVTVRIAYRSATVQFETERRIVRGELNE